MNLTTDINEFDKELILTLANFSVQAYGAFNPDNPTELVKSKLAIPTGYELECHWTGIDSVFGLSKTEEVYGLVIRSNTDPNTYYLAFRGTASILDGIDDLGAELVSFKAIESDVSIPENVEVEAGFVSVYSEDDGPKPSMQQQLFAIIDRLQSSENPIRKLYVTGHSLGSALSEIFTLDLMLCRPEIPKTTINFACPRVGNEEFINLYQKKIADSSDCDVTLRVQNTHDMVPRTPPELLGYKHLPDALLIAFYPHTTSGKLDYLANHSILNYQAVLNCAANSEKGYCENENVAVAGSDCDVKSEKPDSHMLFGM